MAETLAEMEPKTSSAAETSPTTADQAPSSVHAQSRCLPQPPPSLASASSPAMEDGAVVDVAAGDIFAQPEPPPAVATHLPTLLAVVQPSSSASTSPGLLPAFLGEGFPGFAAKLVLLEQLAAWQRDMPPLVSPPSGSVSGLPPPPSSDGCGRPQSPDYELPRLPESLRIPELEETSTQNMLNTIGMIMLPSNCGDLSMGIINSSSSSSTPKLSIGAENSSGLRHVPPPWADGNSNATVVNFNKYERKIISKDRSLQELVTTDPKKVKRLIAYRVYSAKRKAVEDRQTLELQRQVETLQTMRDTKSAELQLVQAQHAELQAEQIETSMMVHRPGSAGDAKRCYE